MLADARAELSPSSLKQGSQTRRATQMLEHLETEMKAAAAARDLSAPPNCATSFYRCANWRRDVQKQS
jgi:hypothetical protein